MADRPAEKIRGILSQELEKGSFPGAVRTCSEAAREITRRFNTKTGHFVRRVTGGAVDVPDDSSPPAF